MIAAAQFYPSQINDVPLYSRAGKPRARFDEEDRLDILGDIDDEYDYFVNLFMPRRGEYIIRRMKDGVDTGWRTVKHGIRAVDIQNHLLGDHLPGREPLWVGGFAWDTSQWVAIDVDDHGDPVEFRQRCRFLERQLAVLGLTSRSLLVLSSPSGGRHYYAFFYKRASIELIREMFKNVGIHHRPGVFEIYPDPKHGFRLPFGHVPHAPPKLDDWRNFVRDHRSKRFPRACIERCWNRSKNFAERNGFSFGYETHCGDSAPHKLDHSPARCTSPRLRSSRLGISKHLQPICSTGGEPRRTTQIVSCEQLHSVQATPGPISSLAEAKALIGRGIPSEGTRVACTKAVAWHFVFAKRLPAGEAVRQCIDWVYATGRETSRDVKNDLARGTRHVEMQTHDIVGWMIGRRQETRRLENGHPARTNFASKEVDALAQCLFALPRSERMDRGRFVLEFLRFAKGHGKPRTAGWTCSPSVRGIIRKWKGCSGTRYKPKLDSVRELGIIEMTREKRQTSNGTGRARTYTIRLPLAKQASCTLSFGDALAYLSEQLANPVNDKPQAAALIESDTYSCLSPHGGEGTSDIVTDPAIVNESRSQGVVSQNNCPSAAVPTKQPTDYTSAADDRRRKTDARQPANRMESTRFTTTDQEGDEHHQDHPYERRHKTAGSEKLHEGDRRPRGLHTAQAQPRPRCPSGAHPGRTRGRLAAREKEFLAQQEIVQGLRDPTPGRQPTAGTIHRARQYLDAEDAAVRAGAEGPTQDELAAIPLNDTAAMGMILDVWRQQARELPLSRVVQLHTQLLAAQQVLENTHLDQTETWLLLANPNRLTPADHYHRDKLLNTHGTPKDSPESITVALPTA